MLKIGWKSPLYLIFFISISAALSAADDSSVNLFVAYTDKALAQSGSVGMMREAANDLATKISAAWRSAGVRRSVKLVGTQLLTDTAESRSYCTNAVRFIYHDGIWDKIYDWRDDTDADWLLLFISGKSCDLTLDIKPLLSGENSIVVPLGCADTSEQKFIEQMAELKQQTEFLSILNSTLSAVAKIRPEPRLEINSASGPDGLNISAVLKTPLGDQLPYGLDLYFRSSPQSEWRQIEYSTGDSAGLVTFLLRNRGEYHLSPRMDRSITSDIINYPGVFDLKLREESRDDTGTSLQALLLSPNGLPIPNEEVILQLINTDRFSWDGYSYLRGITDQDGSVRFHVSEAGRYRAARYIMRLSYRPDKVFSNEVEYLPNSKLSISSVEGVSSSINPRIRGVLAQRDGPAINQSIITLLREVDGQFIAVAHLPSNSSGTVHFEPTTSGVYKLRDQGARVDSLSVEIALPSDMSATPSPTPIVEIPNPGGVNNPDTNPDRAKKPKKKKQKRKSQRKNR